MDFIAHISSENRIQTLEEHLLNVAKISKEKGLKINLPNTAELIGLLHDVGKYSNMFQNYIKSGGKIINKVDEDYIVTEKFKGKIDHSTAGAQLIWHIFNNNKEEKIIGQLIATCIASHHSGLIDCITPDGENNFITRINKDKELTFYEEVKKKLPKEIINKIQENLNNIKNEVLEKLKNILNKTGKNRIIASFQAGLLLRMILSCLLEGDRLDTADFESSENKNLRLHNNYIDWDELIKRLEDYLEKINNNSKSNNKIDEIRKKISDECVSKANNPQGIYTITVPTGGGKTLSSLRFALHHAKTHNLDRIIYIIPYTSIIEQNAKVVREIMEITDEDKEKIVLEHHSNLLPENYSYRNKILSENWDAPIVFTTMVQFLDTLFDPGTRSARRMHQLANSIIIFDEIQTLPVRIVHLFCNAINFLVDHCKTTVVLCTATQPLLNIVDSKKGAINLNSTNELVSDINKLFKDLKRVEITSKTKNEGWTAEEIAEFSKEMAKESKSCLVIVNTKKMARLIYEQFLNSELPVYHLSTYMCAAHRNDIFNKIKLHLSNNEPIICISTQLIEAGVDIDFGCVIRTIAGIDSIIQAAGRCNRNGIREKGKVYIINPKDEKIEKLIDIKAGKNVTERILRELNISNDNSKEIITPENINLYFKYYFYERAEEMDYKITNPHNDSLLNLLSENTISCYEYSRKYNNNTVDLFFKQSFKTANETYKAIDTSTIGIIVPYKEGYEIINQLYSKSSLENKGKLLKSAQRYTVSVYPNILKYMKEKGIVHEVPDIEVYTLSSKEFYNNNYGLTLDKNIQLETLIID